MKTEWDSWKNQAISNQKEIIDELQRMDGPFANNIINLQEFIEDKIKTKINNPVLYLIFLKYPNSNKKKKILNDAKKFHDNNKECALSRINKDIAGNKDGCLYVGTTFDMCFQNRLRQHLDKNRKSRTYALHINCWMENLSELRLVYYSFNSISPDTLHLIEEAVREYYNPIFGKKG